MVPNDLLSCVLPVEEFREINPRAFSSARLNMRRQNSWEDSV